MIFAFQFFLSGQNQKEKGDECKLHHGNCFQRKKCIAHPEAGAGQSLLTRHMPSYFLRYFNSCLGVIDGKSLVRIHPYNTVELISLSGNSVCLEVGLTTGVLSCFILHSISISNNYVSGPGETPSEAPAPKWVSLGGAA